MPTLDAIAKEADVSKATVSLALNGRGRLAEETRTRIREVADRMNYRRRRAGRPSVNKSKQVTVICARQVNTADRVGFFGSLLDGVRSGVEEAGHRANVLVDGGSAGQNLLARRVIEEQSDAVVLVAVQDGSGYLELMERLKKPAVVINATRYPARFSYVGVDNDGGMSQAVEHLIEYGHRHLAMVHNTHTLSYNLERISGFQDTLKRHGLEPAAMLGIDPDAKDADQQYHQLAETLKDKATAVCVTNDHMAVTLADALIDQGVDIPGQMSIVGFDCGHSRTKSGLLPTSIRYDRGRLAREAVAMLDRLFDDPTLGYLSTVLPTKLHVRETSASIEQPRSTHESMSPDSGVVR